MVSKPQAGRDSEVMRNDWKKWAFTQGIEVSKPQAGRDSEVVRNFCNKQKKSSLK